MNRKLKNSIIANKKSKKSKLTDSNELLSDIYTEDIFDKNCIIDIDFDKCVFCRKNHYDGLIIYNKFNNISDIDDGEEEDDVDIIDNKEYNIWISKYNLLSYNYNENNNNNNRVPLRLFAHRYCAIYSPRVIYENNKWYNVKKEITRSKGLKCKVCNINGATIGCSSKTCRNVYHLPCAFTQKSDLKITNNWFCDDHESIRYNKELSDDLLVQNDITLGRERFPIYYNDNNSIHDYNKDYEYYNQNVDSDDIITSIDVNTLDCCQCLDLCYNMDDCSCIAKQRNYSLQGILLPGLTQPIVECNIACSCSTRRCLNRVVSNGIKYKLELYDKTIGSIDYDTITSASSISFGDRPSCEIWGVRTKELIPAGGFICEIIGQYVHNNSKISYINRNKINKQEIRKVSDILLESSENTPALDRLVYPVAMWPGTGPLLSPRQHINSGNYKDKLSNHTFDSIDGVVSEFNDQIDSDDNINNRIDSKIDSKLVNKIENEIERLVNDEDSYFIDPEYIDKYILDEFLKGKLCIDSRYFSNVSRFIIRSFKQKNTNSYLLSRRLVYTDSKLRWPRLALFANVDIPPDTPIEL